MPSVKFSLSGRGAKDLRLSIKKLRVTENSLRRSVRALGDETDKKMKEIIQSRKVRPQAGEPTELENNIDVTHFESSDSVSWGVGDIRKLDAGFPGWKAVNYGSRHIVGLRLPVGGFDPGNPVPNSSDSRKGRWKQERNGWVAVIKNPIPPMNYIESTLFFVKQKFENLAQIFERGR